MATLDIDQHRNRVEGQRAKAAARTRHQQSTVPAQAAIRAEHLTGDPNWDLFLQYLSAEVGRLEDVEKTCSRVLEDPSVTSNETMMAAKMQLHQARSAKTMLEDVIALPKQLIEGGKAPSLEEVATARESDIGSE